MQFLHSAGKNGEKHKSKQLLVMFWLNGRKCGAVSYSFICTARNGHFELLHLKILCYVPECLGFQITSIFKKISFNMVTIDFSIPTETLKHVCTIGFEVQKLNF